MILLVPWPPNTPKPRTVSLSSDRRPELPWWNPQGRRSQLHWQTEETESPSYQGGSCKEEEANSIGEILVQWQKHYRNNLTHCDSHSDALCLLLPRRKDLLDINPRNRPQPQLKASSRNTIMKACSARTPNNFSRALATTISANHLQKKVVARAHQSC